MNTSEQLLVPGPRPDHPASALAICISAIFASGALVLSGCTGQPILPVIHTGMALVADHLVPFASCADALRNLRAAASRVAGSAGFAPGPAPAAGGAAGPGSAGRSAGTADGPSSASQAGPASAGSATPAGLAGPASYSGTNTATAGVDEPDLVKTDGRRIVTVIGGVLRVVDAQTRQLTGVLDLARWAGAYGAEPANLLLAGDHALVMFDQGYPVAGLPLPEGTGLASGTASLPAGIIGPHLLLIDLSAAVPRIISDYTIDGALVDARQVGSVARVVVRSAPRVYFPAGYGRSIPERVTADRAMISRAPLSAWLPRYAVTDGLDQRTGRVNCAAVSHPAAAEYTGTSMLTVLTFGLTGGSLGDGQPVTVIADGDTVYSNGTSLYIANDRQWGMAQYPGPASLPPSSDGPAPAPLPQQYAAIYKFGISGPGRPVYEASGIVPGWLLGSAGTAQYALSEWGGALRVATTTGLPGWSGMPPQSAVYVLEQVGAQLVIVGKVGGLGLGDQIYAVRFAGPVGYVVTYRSVDPLYTLDLSDPAQPRVVGQLPLSGYSAYLYLVDATHLIGVGQDTNALGETTGTQISLLDVSDLAAPARLATYDLQFGHSEAEFDPHAFLYWPASKLLVIPVQLPYGTTPEPVPQDGTAQASPVYSPVSEAVVLHVDDHGFTELGTITHPVTVNYPAGVQIRRSLIIGSALWTLSDAGLKASDSTTLTPLAWVPFSPTSQ
jgi:hypothetical protein